MVMKNIDSLYKVIFMKTNAPSERVKNKGHKLAVFVFSDRSGLNRIYFYCYICQVLIVLSGLQCNLYNSE